MKVTAMANRYAEALARTRKAAAAGSLEAAQEAARFALMLVPRESGRLASTIEAVQNPDGSATFQAGGPEAPYAEVVEYGGVHTPAQPFFHAGMDAGSREAKRTAREQMRELK